MLTIGSGDGMSGGRYEQTSGSKGGWSTQTRCAIVLGPFAMSGPMTDANCLARMSFPPLMRCK